MNNAASVANGNVAFISDNTGRSMYDIKSSVRMYDTSEFEIKSWDEFLGFICGIISGNFDITNIFIDGILKIVHNSMDGFEKFLNDIEDIGAKFNVSFNISVSIDVNEAPDYIKKYA